MTPQFLVIGSGAREHALVKALKRSARNPAVYCFGETRNPGIDVLTAGYAVGDIGNVEAVLAKALQWHIQIAIIGPSESLEKGLADALWQQGIRTIGPRQQLAQIESSKAFARNLLKKYDAPGALAYRYFRTLPDVRAYLEQLGSNHYVIKSDGLLGGQGVKVGGEQVQSFREAEAFCASLVEQGHAFVVEEKLVGQEFSLMCFCDGQRLMPMPVVQTHKRAYANDEGPSTRGMGSYSLPGHRLPFLSDKDLETAMQINQAVISALTYEYREPYIGILHGHFMATKQGVQLISFNVSFGDPEVMNVLSLLKTDFVTLCEAMVSGDLTHGMVQFEKLATVCKYVVPQGYPDQLVKPVALDVEAVRDKDQLYLGAVTVEKGQLVATGGSAVAVVGVADNIVDAERIAEADIQRVEGSFFHREDIGTRELINRRILQMQNLRQRDYRLL